MPSELPAAAAGSMTLGGDLVVRRMGFGSMRLTGQGIWGDPPDRAKAHAVLRRAVDWGSTSSTPPTPTAPR
jgi:aryl-alcohol dehydrogenase-like predicted oxidoreductase